MSSNQRSPTTDAPPPTQARITTSVVIPAIRRERCLLFAGVSLLDQRIGTLGNLHNPVSGHILEFLRDSGAWPAHHHFVHRRRIAETEILPQRILRPVTISQHDLPHLRPAFHGDRHARPDRIPVGFCPYQLHPEPVPPAADFV